jgi:hypothetical protein
MGMLDLPRSLKGDLETRPPSTTCFQLLELRRAREMRGEGAISDVGESRLAMRRGVVDWGCQPSFVTRGRKGVSEVIASGNVQNVGSDERGFRDDEGDGRVEPSSTFT